VDDLATIAAACVAPATALVLGIAKYMLDKQKQEHEQAVAVQRQQHEQSVVEKQLEHSITKEYLDRALNPQTPFEFRHATLRFLAVPDNGKRLQNWATNEIAALDGFKESVVKDVEKAQAEVASAKNDPEREAAKGRLRVAAVKQKSVGGATSPVATPEAIRAGFFDWRAMLDGHNFEGADLQEAKLLRASLVGVNFAGANLRRAVLQEANLQGANLAAANLTDAFCNDADFTGADLRDAKLARIQGARIRLHGADLTGATLQGSTLAGTTYDDSTRWPTDCEPERLGAVKIPLEEILIRERAAREARRRRASREAEAMMGQATDDID
jgi:hypothetical protein